MNLSLSHNHSILESLSLSHSILEPAVLLQFYYSRTAGL